MEYLHGINVIHRDLKSENCLVGCDGEVKSTENKFVVKVGDFGTATHGEQPELVTGVGTPLWSVHHSPVVFGDSHMCACPLRSGLVCGVAGFGGAV